MPLLSTKDLSLTIGGQRILHGVTIDVKEGEVIGLIGPNGSGKTTLFNVLSGFLKPSRGSIHFQKSDITALAAPERWHIGIGEIVLEGTPEEVRGNTKLKELYFGADPTE